MISSGRFIRYISILKVLKVFTVLDGKYAHKHILKNFKLYYTTLPGAHTRFTNMR